MNIISWNVNGLRALHRGGRWGWLERESPDIICLQEIKAEESQLPPDLLTPEGYRAYFSSSKERKGYSGVALYTKHEPNTIVFDPLPERFKTEGRLIESVFDRFTIFNAYIPNGGRNAKRLQFKLDYYDALFERMETLRAEGRAIVLCGDINTAHEDIDLARPRENAEYSGFLPEERAWLDELVRLGYLDTFRYIHPNTVGAYTYWDQVTRARERNIGWRIDYFFVSPDLAANIVSSDIHAEVYGSDHCPISLELKF